MQELWIADGGLKTVSEMDAFRENTRRVRHRTEWRSSATGDEGAASATRQKDAQEAIGGSWPLDAQAKFVVQKTS